MRDYRVYYLGDNGRIVRREVIRCSDDAQAVTLLRREAGEHAAVELWDLGRLVKRIEGGDL